MSVVASAPGKLMVAGEYAVLRGAPCLVAAVNRRALVTLDTLADAPPGALPPEAVAARRIAEGVVGPVTGQMCLDVAALRSSSGDAKLGLGSSAAAAAGAAAVVFAHHGRSLSDPTTRQEVLQAAMAGHQEVAPEGSGADVAAAVLGGLVRYQRHDLLEQAAAPSQEGQPWQFTARALQEPLTVPMLVIWTGQPARTSDFLAQVNRFSDAEPNAAAACFTRIADAAEAMLGALKVADLTEFLRATREHHQAMAGLGEAAGANIVEARLAKCAALAEQVGGAAKPSGAGGGDAALAFFPDENSKARCSKACEEHGLALLSLQLGAEGVSREGPSGT